MHRMFPKIAVVMVLVISLTALFTGCSTTTIKMTDYTTVKFMGLDGKGEADVEIDKDALYKKIFGESVTAASATAQQEKTIAAIKSALEYKIDKEDELSNGDTVTVSFAELSELPKDVKVKFSESVKEFKVEGLTIPKTVDPFAYADVHYTGVAPFATAKVENTAKEAPFNSIEFSVAPPSGQSNGDTITITAHCEESKLDKAAIVLSPTQKTVTVEGISAYVTDLTQIPQSLNDELLKEAQDLVSAYFADGHTTIMERILEKARPFNPTDRVHNNFVHISSYLLNVKPGKEPNRSKNSNINNQLQIACSMAGTDSASTAPTTVYFVVCFNNLVVDTSGNVNYDDSDSFVGGYYTSPESQYTDSVDKNKDKYAVQEKRN